MHMYGTQVSEVEQQLACVQDHKLALKQVRPPGTLIYARMYVCMCVCVCMCACIYVYVCMYVYVYMQTCLHV